MNRRAEFYLWQPNIENVPTHKSSVTTQLSVQRSTTISVNLDISNFRILKHVIT